MTSRERPAWQVRIRRSAAAAPVGAGVLCNDGQVVTCAHVISPSQSSASPMEPVYVEFQFAGWHEPIPATVVPGGWMPERPDRSGDVGVLRLHGPPPDGALPAPLCYSEAGVWDHRYRAYGYPRGHERTGVWSKGIVVGAAEVEWLQLQADSALGFALEGGFSGAPVWDENLDAVIGIVVTRERPRGDKGDPRIGFAIPVEVIEQHWPPLGQSVGPRPSPAQATPLPEETAHLLRLLGIHERSVRILEEQEARYSGAAPVHLITQLEDERAQVAELRRRLGPEA
jgi:cellulose synthase operon protein C